VTTPPWHTRARNELELAVGGVQLRALERAIADRHALVVLAGAVEGQSGGGDGDVEGRVTGLLGGRRSLYVSG
jgi:hypothetical protein